MEASNMTYEEGMDVVLELAREANQAMMKGIIIGLVLGVLLSEVCRFIARVSSKASEKKVTVSLDVCPTGGLQDGKDKGFPKRCGPLEELNMTTLKGLLKDRKLMVSGNKADLVERLLEFEWAKLLQKVD